MLLKLPYLIISKILKISVWSLSPHSPNIIKNRIYFAQKFISIPPTQNLPILSAYTPLSSQLKWAIALSLPGTGQSSSSALLLSCNLLSSSSPHATNASKAKQDFQRNASPTTSSTISTVMQPPLTSICSQPNGQSRSIALGATSSPGWS